MDSDFFVTDRGVSGGIAYFSKLMSVFLDAIATSLGNVIYLLAPKF